MPKLTIAIPTYNRLDKLTQAIHHIKELDLPSQWNLCLAISNIASSDGTFDYLNNLRLTNIELVVCNKKNKELNRNLIYLSTIVPKDSDWVWVHGDDDYILNKGAIFILNEAINKYPHVDLLITPQSKRLSGNNLRISESLINLCKRYGFHEMLGWMSQVIMSYDNFTSYMQDYGFKYTYPYLTSTNNDLLVNQISAFPHSTSILKHFYVNNSLLIDSHIIDEQVPPEQKKEYSYNSSIEQHLRHRFFYVINEFIDIKNILSCCPDIFYRYVDRDFRLLLLDILISDILASDFSILTLQKISILEKLINEASIQQNNSVVISTINNTLRLIHHIILGDARVDSFNLLNKIHNDIKKKRYPFFIS